MSHSWQFILTNWREMLVLIREHLQLVFLSTAIAVSIGVPIGILISRRPLLRGPVLGLANVMQTIPSLALFGLLIPLPLVGGIGATPAIIALVLYALLPVIRNTVTGILGVDPVVREAAVAMGMTQGQILWQVELPLAVSVILTGIRVAVVISFGVATVAAAVGAGGLGVYIFRGLRQNDNTLLLAGAIPAAMMALGADFLLGYFEKRFDASRRRTGTTIAGHKLRWILIATAAIIVIACGIFVSYRKTLGRNQVTPSIAVGSKDFTESIVLGEIVAELLEDRGIQVERSFELGGNLAQDSLVSGKIDLYPEYTGTAYTAILHHQPITDTSAVYEEVKREYQQNFDLNVSAPLGFSNDFAILIRGEDARRLNLKTISGVAAYAPQWRAGFGQDFMSRQDGYPGFARAYGLQFGQPPREMDLSLTYRALAEKQVDIIAGNSTDGLIAALDLYQLADDKHYFPPYQAVIITRSDALKRCPALAEVLDSLTGRLSTDEMRRLNNEIDNQKLDRREVAREWITAAKLK